MVKIDGIEEKDTIRIIKDNPEDDQILGIRKLNIIEEEMVEKEAKVRKLKV